MKAEKQSEPAIPHVSSPKLDTVEFTFIKFLAGSVHQILSAGFNFGLCVSMDDVQED